MAQPVVDRIQMAQQRNVQRKRRQDITALVLLFLGTVLCVLSLWVLFGLWYALLFLGIEFVALGVLIGVNN